MFLLAACATVECGPGTHLDGDTCVADAELGDQADPSHPYTDTDPGTDDACPWVGSWDITAICDSHPSSFADGDLGLVEITGDAGGCSLDVETFLDDGCSLAQDLYLEAHGYTWTATSAGGVDDPLGCFAGDGGPQSLGEVAIDDTEGLRLGFALYPYVIGGICRPIALTLTPSI